MNFEQEHPSPETDDLIILAKEPMEPAKSSEA